METKVAKDTSRQSQKVLLLTDISVLNVYDFLSDSSDESGGETSHTGSRCVSRNGTTWTTEPLAASRRKEVYNILRTASEDQQ
ncbi:hypothetical protein T01_9831 [Trichinella spiralis]|uniref:Uncharacterized protein n=1 Tax=Trichinella spiralis TaxID=6334 RepID=A0A0V1ARD9_TRISP|nr:hypothetical protein T01_9831 [Trichinella spiralis]